MTQTLIEQLEAFIDERLIGIDKTEIESDQGWWETSGGADFGESILSDLHAIIEQHKQEVGKNADSRKESYSIIDRFLRNNLDDDSYSDYSNCLDDLYHSQPSNTQQATIERLTEQRDAAVKAVRDIIELDNFKSGYALIAEIEAGK